MLRRYRADDLDEPMDETNDNISVPTQNSATDQQIHHHNLLLLQQDQHKLLKRSQMNELIMDYLVHEGFKEAAERFREEAGIQPKMATETMDKRIEIRHKIEDGNIIGARSLINDYYPELLEDNHDINFRLHQQHLIELIRNQKIDEVLSYVHEQLSVDESKDLGEMERTLALLAYEKPDKSPYASLLEPSHRLELASEINDMLLQITCGQIEPTKPRLVTLLKLLFWTQNELEKKKIPFPKMTDLFRSSNMLNVTSEANLSDESGGSQMM